MRGVNKSIFIGYTGSEVDVRYTPNGTPVAHVSLALNETWKDKEGNTKEKTEWVRLVGWRKIAEIMGQYVKKGQLLYVEAKVTTRRFEKDGETHYFTEFNIQNLQILSRKPEEPATTTEEDGEVTNENGGSAF